MRPMAPNAFLRPCQSRARSAASVATRTARAPASRQKRVDARGVLIESGCRAVQLDEQDRRRVGRIAGGVDRRLDRLDRRRVHHLERGRHDPGRDDRRHGLAAASTRREIGEQRAHRLRDCATSRTVTSSATPKQPSDPMNAPSRS